ncbi:MAG TPA: NAD(P)-dependent oxidoreductase [Jatrophihabitans sp.]|uniref:NAD-dependent epimerase/dehydratase family protein n=1 Tax=Jatrophihabitans sp. TaxID=1932789 RepID=UPI002F2213A9
MTVLITGCSGVIGSSLATLLPAMGWQLRGFDREPATTPIKQVQGDITDPDALDQAMAGVRAVVHLAGRSTEAPWPEIRDANIDGVYQVFEAARRAGVRRVVYASSNHAVGFTPRQPGQAADGQRSPAGDPTAAGAAELAADTPPRPDTLYGVSKVFGEALGRYYVDRYAMQVACLRIGTFADSPPHARAMSTWLSPRDCASLVDACLRTDQLGFALVWGVSANRDRWWSLDAGRALGYQPLDDASKLRSDPPGAEGEDVLVGGGFTDPPFGIDEVRQRAQEQAR